MKQLLTAGILVFAVLFDPASAQDLPVAPDKASATLFDAPAFYAGALQTAGAKAANGDAGTAFLLAKYLLANDRTPDQRKQGLAELRIAARAGVPEAMTRLADILANGQFGVAIDPIAAARLYENSVAANDNNARRGLAALLLAGKGVPLDPKRAADLLTTAASLGDLSAINQLALLSARGQGVEQDVAKAIDLYQVGIAIHNNQALNGLGDIYRLGTGARIDAAKARALYAEAVANGDIGAQKKIADMLIKGEGSAADFAGGIALLEQLAQKGDIASFVAIGDYYLKAPGVVPNGEQAASSYRQAADAGNAGAMSKLGQLYRNGGGGLAKDAVQAYDFFQKAAALGDLGSKRSLADMQARGEGISADLTAAIASLTAAGDNASLVLAGDFYARGEVGAPDLPEAVTYYKKAAAAGDISALVRLGDLYKAGSGPVVADPKAAIGYYEQAVTLGDAGSRRSLSALLLTPPAGLEPNPKRAIALLDEAANAGDAAAMQQLGLLYSAGGPIPPDYQKSASYFDRSAKAGNLAARLRQGVSLVSGPLAATKAAEGEKILRQAIIDNIAGAPLELAKLQLNGQIESAMPADAIATLQPAIAANDINAVRFLIGIYRDGVKDRAEADPVAASKLIADKTELLGPEITALERLMVTGKSPANASAIESATSDFKQLGVSNAVGVLQRFSGQAPNLYVAILQSELSARKLYSGKLDGTLDQPTITALNRFCESQNLSAICAPGPMRGEAAAALAKAMKWPA
ncbi:hypothetical protein [Devosia sp.]|uniref:tetratricopeptide repeat protein n=1 Tax=Devosia sp. TaxID=1871048 RepID=UPI0032676838